METHSQKSEGLEPLYSIRDAAIKLGGISRHTVAAWLAQGKLQRTKVGCRTMIAESELRRIVKAQPRQEAA